MKIIGLNYGEIEANSLAFGLIESRLSIGESLSKLP
jgi:hypothetical protein